MHVTVGQKDRKVGDKVHSLHSSRLKIDFQVILRPPNLVGRLLHFLPNWRQITSDPDILMTVAGYKLPFTSPQHQTSAKAPLTFSRHELEKVDSEVALLREKGVLHVACPVPNQFVSSLFLVPKRDGNSRPVINLKDLRSSVRSLQDGGHPSSARSSAAQRLARQDRSEGRVFCDPNLARSQKIPALCLEANSPQICMPSVRSCSSPPCIYEDYETSSVASTPDRDSTDNLFGRHSPYECVRDRSPARHAYSSILIKEPRFCDQSREILFSANPAIRISRVSSEHSGYDSAPARLQSEFNQDALFNSTISTRCFSTELSQLIGKLTASIQAIFPAPLHYRNLQQLKHQAVSRDRNFNSRIPLSVEAIGELRWWLAHLDAWNGRALLHPSPDLIMETDASRMGWGAVCQGVRTGGCGLRWMWSPYQLSGAPG